MAHKTLCPSCGSDKVILSGRMMLASGENKQRYKCMNIAEGCARLFTEDTADFEVIEENISLAKRLQKSRDANRIKDKSFREVTRVENAIGEYTQELIKVFRDNAINFRTVKHKANTEGVALIAHISDPHFNELINLPHNKYDFTFASKRLQKFAYKLKRIARLNNVKQIVVALTGDLMNSDRRLDELLMQSTNRSKATFLAYELLSKFIIDLNKTANITVCTVTGNESRIGLLRGLVDPVATDNYDYTIFQLLKLGFKNKKGVSFHEGDPVEYYFNIAGQNILMLHGESLGDSNTQKTIQQVVGKYAKRDIIIHFVIFGHLHTCYISDWFARSSSLAGSNDYNEKGLNLAGKASQNGYLVSKTGIDKFNFDLQDVSLYEGYPIAEELEAYNAKSVSKLIQHKPVLEIII